VMKVTQNGKTDRGRTPPATWAVPWACGRSWDQPRRLGGRGGSDRQGSRKEDISAGWSAYARPAKGRPGRLTSLIGFERRPTDLIGPSQLRRQPLTKTWQRSRVGTPRDRPRRTDDPRNATAEALVPGGCHRFGGDASGRSGLPSCHRRARIGRRLVPAPRQYNHDLVNYHVNLTDDNDIDDRYAVRKARRARLRQPSQDPLLPCAPAP